MATRRVVLKYTEGLIKEPLLFRMAKQFDVEPNIRRARVDEFVGEIAVELEGPADRLAAGLKWLEDAGVLVEPLEGDVVE